MGAPAATAHHATRTNKKEHIICVPFFFLAHSLIFQDRACNDSSVEETTKLLIYTAVVRLMLPVLSHPPPVLRSSARGKYSRSREVGVEGVLDEDRHASRNRGLHGLGVDNLCAEVGELHRFVEGHLVGRDEATNRLITRLTRSLVSVRVRVCGCTRPLLEHSSRLIAQLQCYHHRRLQSRTKSWTLNSVGTSFHLP